MYILIRGTNFVFMTFASETVSDPVKVYFLKNPMFDLVKLGNKIPQMKIQCLKMHPMFYSKCSNENCFK